MSVQAIDWALRLVQEITPTQKLILICLANHAGPDGRCWPAQETLSEYSGLARQTINRTLSDLESGGFIESSRRKDESGRDLSKVYRLNMAKTRGVSQSDTGVSEGDRECHPVRQGGVSQSDTKQQQEPSLEPSKKQQQKSWKNVVVSFGNVDQQKSDKPGEQKCSPGEGRDLLLGIGVSPGDAEKLSADHSLDEIRAWVAKGKEKAKTNPGGYVRQALKEGWKITAPGRADSGPQAAYRDDIEIWHALSAGVRSRLLAGSGGLAGSNLDYPDPAWLRKRLEELEAAR